MSTSQKKFLSALTLAFHEATIDADIVAGIRGASRLLRGKTISDFLGLPAIEQLSAKVAELQQALATSEVKLEGAVEYVSELKLEIQRLQVELQTAKPAPKPAAPKPQIGTFSKGEAIWLSGVVAFFGVSPFIVALVVFASSPPEKMATATRPAPIVAQTQPVSGASEPQGYGVSDPQGYEPQAYRGPSISLCAPPHFRMTERDGCQAVR